MERLSPERVQAILRDLDKVDAAESLEYFTELMWSVIEPAIPFVPGWPYDAICEHLQAVSDGQIKRLLINISPGSTKSTAALVMYPAWEWGPLNHPYLRYLTSSYSSSLTERHNSRFGKLVSSDVYQALWGHQFKIIRIGDIRVENDKTGWVLASSVEGVGTGSRADRVLVDDPNNVLHSESTTIREKTNLWFREVMPDRLNDQDESAIVVIQQRTHDADVSGTIIDNEMGYVHLNIPAEYDAERHCHTVIGWDDPRGCDDDGVPLPDVTTAEDPRPAKLTRNGILYWPARISAQALSDLKRDKGPVAYSGQYQQLPVARGGGVIQRDWWKMWEPTTFPPFDFVLGSLDTAQSAREENDFNAMTLLGVFNHLGRRNVMLMAAWQSRIQLHLLPATADQMKAWGISPNMNPVKRAQALEEIGRIGVVEKVAAYCDHHRVNTLIIENKANGHAANELLSELYAHRGWNTELVDPSGQGDKVARARSTIPEFAEGMIWAPAGYDENGRWTGFFREWAEPAIKQLEVLGKGRHDDVADCVVQGIRWLRQNGIIMMPSEIRRREDEERQSTDRVRPLYPGTRRR